MPQCAPGASLSLPPELLLNPLLESESLSLLLLESDPLLLESEPLLLESELLPLLLLESESLLLLPLLLLESESDEDELDGDAFLFFLPLADFHLSPALSAPDLAASFS